MKLILASLVVAIGFAAIAQWNIVKIPPSPNVLNTTDFSYPPALTIADPYRVINNITQRVDRTWLAIKAEVIQVHPREGVRVKGIVEGINMQDEDFFIINLPYLVAEKSVIPAPGFVYLFRPAGTYTYSTAAGSSRTIRQFDYGTPWKPPALTPEELAAFKLKTDAAKKAGKANAVKFNQEAADKGDAYGLFRMGERYRDGDGVDKDLKHARVLFIQAQDAGSTTASNALANLPP